MALNMVKGTAPFAVRNQLGQELQVSVCEIIKDDATDPDQYSWEALPDGCYGGEYGLYLWVVCNPNDTREAEGQAMADQIRAKVGEMPVAAGHRKGVWFDIGKKRFWSSDPK